jgi:hypothetical protein
LGLAEKCLALPAADQVLAAAQAFASERGETLVAASAMEPIPS